MATLHCKSRKSFVCVAEGDTSINQDVFWRPAEHATADVYGLFYDLNMLTLYRPFQAYIKIFILVFILV